MAAVRVTILYLTAVLASSIVGLVAWTVGLSVTLSVAVLVFGVLLWVPAALALRGVASLDRGLVGLVPAPARCSLATAGRRRPARSISSRPRCSDPRIWADLKWAVLNSILGFVAATVAIAVTAEVVSLVLMPLWWWALSDPEHQYATLNLGIYTVTSTGWALVTTGIGLALAPVALLIHIRRGRLGSQPRGAEPARATAQAASASTRHAGRAAPARPPARGMAPAPRAHAALPPRHRIGTKPAQTWHICVLDRSHDLGHDHGPYLATLKPKKSRSSRRDARVDRDRGASRARLDRVRAHVRQGDLGAPQAVRRYRYRRGARRASRRSASSSRTAPS